MEKRAPSTRTLLVSDPPRPCPRCGADMEERKCKIICRRCGATADCSDP